MKRGNLKRALRIAAGVVLSAAMVTVMGQGCGLGITGGQNAASNFGACGSAGSNISSDYTVVDGQSTISIGYGSQLLYSFLACTGVGTPSARTMNEFTTRQLALSDYGDLRDISPANFMAITAIAIEVCQDLVDKEEPLANANRGIFPNVNLAGNGLSNNEIDSIGSMLALACWPRPIDAAELVDIRNTISSVSQNSEVQAVTLCTAMLSSFAGIQN